jgi:hypothetical protein
LIFFNVSILGAHDGRGPQRVLVGSSLASTSLDKPAEQWRHVPGDINAADLATPGINVSICWHRPEHGKKDHAQFRLETETSWPACVPGTDTLQSGAKEEYKMVRTNAAEVLDNIMSSIHGSFQMLDDLLTLGHGLDVLRTMAKVESRKEI